MSYKYDSSEKSQKLQCVATSKLKMEIRIIVCRIYTGTILTQATAKHQGSKRLY